MPRTDAQRAADSVLTDAINAAARAYELMPDDAIPVDFVVVVEGARYGEDPDEFEEFHGLMFREGGTRKSVAAGLLRIGEDLVLRGERVDPGEP